MILLNPLGLLALLAIPLVIAIHFLQRRAQIVPISTLFLLNKTQKESASGRKFDRLMNSIPLWLQLLIVLLITWLLVQPRYIKANSTQRIAIVLDSSASMSVFKQQVKSKLTEVLPQLQGNAEQAEYWLLDSNPSHPRLYHGNSLEKLTATIDSWNPSDGASSPNHTLRIARSLAGNEGAVIYLTDTPRRAISYNAHVYAIGSVTENCGFTGISFSRNNGTLIWQTLIRNYSHTPQTRTWYLEDQNGKRTKQKSITIPARKIISLQGKFPAHSTRAKLVLSTDDFTLDDTLPLIKPLPKSLTLHSSSLTEHHNLAQKIATSFPNIKLTDQSADADLLIIPASQLNLHNDHNTISFIHSSLNSAPYLNGSIVAEKHPLTNGLNFQSLLVRQVPSRHLLDTDQVIVWQGKRPLILLRHHRNRTTSLIFNFDIKLSNFSKTEAPIVLLLRHIETIRSAKLSHQRLITETSQPLKLTTPPISKKSPLLYQITPLDSNKTTTRTLTTARKLYAPKFPCYFTISHSDSPLLTAANYFADTREADFSHCATAYLPASTSATAVARHTRQDHLWRYWLALALIALLLTWHYSNRANNREQVADSMK